ncbi:MAG: indolepyruvate ferredoxin oxidoreductase [Solirubrobacterales bacterium]|nr:indolepyruvate ferredoxin oxidoreductase [Solirubrobacterales bacterium]
MTGVEALVRVPLDQSRADRRRGLHTGTMISGYQGSPLGGFDRELEANQAICEANGIHHVPGLNEELGATAAWGSQLAGALPGSNYDGVLAMWYGKAPGLDRASDALRHGNFVGTSRTGGAIAAVGDDPSCRSSSIPSASESLLAALRIPVFYPGSVQEVLDLGLHAFACSRASGLWSGMKMVTNVADAVATADVDPGRIVPQAPNGGRSGDGYEHVPSGHLLAPPSLEMEASLYGPRTDLALAYARENGLNRIEGASDAWLGILAAGKSYYDLRHALRNLGLDGATLERVGVRLLKPGMIWPLEPSVSRAFARELEEVLVIEEKMPFLESQLKDLLYGGTDCPRIVGKRDEAGDRLVPAEAELDADAIARVVAARLGRRVRLDSVAARIRRLDEIAARPIALPVARTPFFCSGCPHNSSIKAPDGTLVGAGIGCHTMVLLAPDGKGEITGLTQMGGEGAQWIGQAPFTDERHLVQNIGDGTFHHSGSLALRAAVAAGVNITYKILYNDHVAMTGGQHVEGQISVPDLTRWLELEGVKQVIVTSDEPGRYKGVKLASIAELRDRRQLLAAQKELAREDGVTVLIHDQECAAELRRKRKRGEAPEPAERVWINERVCEGCGDCGEKSSCLSVRPTETEFGRKTQIHQASCNKDYSCLEGDCPSFVTVVPGKKAKRKAPSPPNGMPEPEALVSAEEFTVRMIGIGGTGVVTVNQIVGMAGLIDGLHVYGLDQTGLSQKGGPVTSDLRLSRHPLASASKTPAGEVDLYLAFDLLGATAEKNLITAHPERTVAVVSTSAVPTGQMVTDSEKRFPELAGQLDQIEAATAKESNVYLDAQELSDRLFGSDMPANMIALGAAYQRGALPVSLRSLEQAIRINGAAVEANITALAWGRAVVGAPDAVEKATFDPGAQADAPELGASERGLVDLALGAESPQVAEVRLTVERRVAELASYQSLDYARRYAESLRGVRNAEAERTPGHTELTAAVAEHMFKVMAYKDEYEVARLHLDAVERAKLDSEFGDGAKVWFNLHPPLLRALGLKRKLKLGPWFVPAFRLLRAARRLRGTRLDVFGYAKVRRVERALIGEYEQLVAEACNLLTSDNHATAVELCELPDVIRGYEQIKLRNVALFRQRAEPLRRRLRGRSPARETQPAA